MTSHAQIPASGSEAPMPVIFMAAHAFDITGEALLARCREAELVRARALVTWALRAIPVKPLSYAAIGRVLGGLHPSSVSDLHQKAIYLRLKDPAFKAACGSLLTQCSISEEMLDACR